MRVLKTVKEESQGGAHLKNYIKVVRGDDAPKNEYLWGVLHQGPLSLVKNNMAFACSCAAGCFTGSREGKCSSDSCKGKNTLLDHVELINLSLHS